MYLLKVSSEIVMLLVGDNDRSKQYGFKGAIWQ